MISKKSIVDFMALCLCGVIGVGLYGIYMIKDSMEKEAQDRRNVIKTTYVFKNRPDTMLVINKGTELVFTDAQITGENKYMELSTRNGAPLSYTINDKIDNMSAVRGARRGDTLLVHTSQTADSVYHYRIVRNITADNIRRQFARQK